MSDLHCGTASCCLYCMPVHRSRSSSRYPAEFRSIHFPRPHDEIQLEGSSLALSPALLFLPLRLPLHRMCLRSRRRRQLVGEGARRIQTHRVPSFPVMANCENQMRTGDCPQFRPQRTALAHPLSKTHRDSPLLGATLRKLRMPRLHGNPW